MSGSLAQTMSGLVQAYDEPAVATTRIPRQTSLDLVEVYPYVPYIQYLLPGSIVMAVFMMVMIGGGIIFIDDKARGLHEGYLVTPITKLELIAGFNLSGAIKAVLAGVVLLVVGSLVAGIPDPFAPLRLLKLFTVPAMIVDAAVAVTVVVLLPMTPAKDMATALLFVPSSRSVTLIVFG